MSLLSWILPQLCLCLLGFKCQDVSLVKHCISSCVRNQIFCSICGCTVEVLVLVDFESTVGDELSVKMGDVVKNVTKSTEEGWLHGELRGKKGIFPANFAKVW